MRRLYFRLIVPDGPLRRFRLAEDFGEERKLDEGSAFGRVAGMSLAWCGLSAGCWLLAEGHLLPSLSFDPVVALSDDARSTRWAMAVPGADQSFFSAPGTNRVNATLDRAAEANAPKLASVQPVAADVNLNAVANPNRTVRRDLPKVTYSVSVLHQGGEFGREEAPTLDTAPAMLPRAEPMDDPTPSGSSLHAPASRNASTDVDTNAPSARHFDEPGVGSSPTTIAAAPAQSPAPYRSLASNDPFEADFVPVRPILPLSAEQALPRRESVTSTSREPRREPALSETQGSKRGGSHVLTTGGGCQAAFEASNQVVSVGKSVVGTDATSEDYTAALSRLNVAGCHPTSRVSIQVCVAVSERRAVGTTVTTSPANAAVATCIARQVAGLRFPASTGADLVRTRIDVE